MRIKIELELESEAEIRMGKDLIVAIQQLTKDFKILGPEYKAEAVSQNSPRPSSRRGEPQIRKLEAEVNRTDTGYSSTDPGYSSMTPALPPPDSSSLATKAKFNPFLNTVAELEAGDSDTAERVARDIEVFLTSGGVSMEFLIAAFQLVVFNEDPAERPPSAVPFMSVFNFLTDRIRVQLRDAMVPILLKKLTVNRPVNCDRSDFFCYAESFAALVSLSVVPITGAIQTLVSLFFIVKLANVRILAPSPRQKNSQ